MILLKLWTGFMFMMCVLSLVAFPLMSSGAVQEKLLDVKMDNVSLEEVIWELEKKSDFTFMYWTEDVKNVNGLSLDLKQKSVKEILGHCLKDTELCFDINGETIIIHKENQEEEEQHIVRGIVKDSKGNVLPGATILVKGSTVGVVSDVDGCFTLKVNTPKVELVVSFVGMETKEIEWQGEKELVVILQEDIKEMEEVVITGYGNVMKGNYTGSTTTVKAKDIMMAGVNSIDQMLQGVVPGMLVYNTTGQVGSTPKIRVRGTSTLLGDQEPLWVVDGVIQQNPQPFYSEYNTQFSVSADDIRQLAGNAISWLNPNDIETITILKDASATAIYGSKAANGVIVITTKKASIGKVVVNYAGDFSIGQRLRYGLYDLMNSEENMEFSREIYDERRKYPVGNYALPIGYRGLREKLLRKEITMEEMEREYQRMAKQNTDWFDILFRNSFNHSHSLGISGGSEKIQNRTSLGFSEEKGEAKGNDMKLFSATSNTTVSLWDRVVVNLLLKGSLREVNGFAYGVDPFGYAYNTSRVIPAYNDDGTLYFHEKMGDASTVVSGKYIYNYNILHEKENTHSENTTRSWGVSFDLRWKIFDGLEYQGLFAYNSSSADVKQYATERSFYITQIRGYEYGSYSNNSDEASCSRLPIGGLLENSLTNTTSITVRNSLVYDKLIKERHRLTLQLGVETNSVKTKGDASQRYGFLLERGESFANPPSTYWQNGTYERDNTIISQGNLTILNRIQNELSEYASFVYSYDDRYVLNLNGRVDASNRFGQDKNKRFEPTWSIGGKWRLGNELFLLDQDWLNTFDIYASYGYQGNSVTTVSPNLIGSYRYMLLYSNFGLAISSLPYPDLGWEKTKTYNLGIDASFLKGRVNFTFNYYKKVSDVLASHEVPYENGMANGVVGGSQMENSGYDLVVNMIPVRMKDISWQLSINASKTNNKLRENNRINTLRDYLYGSAIVEGEPYSTFYSYEFDKLDGEYGQPLFKHMDVEEGTMLADPSEFLVKTGKFTPDFTGGLSTMFKYKNLSFYMLLAFQGGGNRRLPNLYPATATNTGLPNPEENVSRKLKNRWRQPGDEAWTNIPSLPGTGFEDQLLPTTAISQGYTENRYVMYNQSDIRVASTDFIRCRSISLSYDFTQEWLKKMAMERLQAKVTMNNPFMWVKDKKWDGLDPETGNWPTRRVISLSLQVMF